MNEQCNSVAMVLEKIKKEGKQRMRTNRDIIKQVKNFKNGEHNFPF